MTTRDYAWRYLIGAGMILFIVSSGRQPWLHTLSTFMIPVGVIGGIEHFFRKVWPTPYKLERDSGHLLRVHRITHQVDILTPLGWKRITDSDSHREEPRDF